MSTSQTQSSKNQDPLLVYYHDAKAEQPLPTDSRGNFKVDFGEDAKKNPPRAGIDSIFTTIYVKNAHHYPMELQPVSIDKDLQITEWPEFLEPGDIGKVTLAFRPSADRIKPLEGGTWDFTKIVYSNTRTG